MSEHRLPPTATPRAYRLHLTADPAQQSFAGRVAIDVELPASQPRDVFELHASRIDVTQAQVEQTGRTIAAAPETEGDRLRLRLTEPLEPGTATIHIEYTGNVRSDMAGLYLSKDGDRICLATQCEATDARSIVPCWDEPAYKATWQWSVTAPEGLTVLTNGARESSDSERGQTTHRFAATPPMSSYLIACCIGDFAATEPVTARGKDFRVWAMRGQEQHGAHGNELAVQMLPWYEDYFGQEYAFGKYDQIAVPSFAFGAMENAGLVLFRPSLILLDEQTASWDDRRHVALVVAHEFAHMWFGDLVTMAWWDDLWLNEAFAEWIAHKCAEATDPSLDVWVPFRQRAAGALSTDALASTHAIYHPVKTPEEAQEMFDAITYGKGSAVMRMLESYLGDDAFRNGLQSYMAAFRFDNAHGKDLWQHLGDASGEDVAGIMGDWITQAGHPTITVQADGDTLRLRQRRTVSSPLADVQPTTWRIPLVIRYGDDAGAHEHRVLMDDAETSIQLPVQGTLQWVWPNAGDGGFYRCDLRGDLLDAALAHAGDLTPPERVGLLRDMWMQVRAGHRDVTTFLTAYADLLDATDHYESVEFQVGVARTLDALLQDDTEAQDAFRAWLATQLRAGWETPAQSDPDRQRRTAVLRGLGIALDPSAVDAARDLADHERQDPSGVEAGLAGAAIAIEALAGGRDTLENHLATYRARRDGDHSPQEVERYVYALPAFRDPDAVQEVLHLLAAQGVAAQAEGPILRAMIASPYNGRAAWQHLKAHREATLARLGEAWLGIIVEACGELPVDLADEVEAFWDKHLNGRAQQSYNRAKERLRERAEFEERVKPEVQKWATGPQQTARAAA